MLVSVMSTESIQSCNSKTPKSGERNNWLVKMHFTYIFSEGYFSFMVYGFQGHGIIEFIHLFCLTYFSTFCSGLTMMG